MKAQVIPALFLWTFFNLYGTIYISFTNARGNLMKTLTICGSMRFAKEMMQIAYQLEAQEGYNILQCVYCEDVPVDEELKQLEAAHYRKIDLSDGIYVVNIGGYIGESVRKEIDYAEKSGKEVIYHCGTH